MPQVFVIEQLHEITKGRTQSSAARTYQSRISTWNATHLFALRVRSLDNFSMSPPSRSKSFHGALDGSVHPRGMYVVAGPILSAAHRSSSHQPPSALSRLLSSSRLILLVFKLRLLVSFVFDTDAVERDNTCIPFPSEVHFVMAPIITVRLARGLWMHPTNLGIALRAMGECADWA
ncbi:uncharacterized protein STEHIDRAFT_159190 [Stereum hirsutum FP-91666 SS1]|uniref:uncharacterized protein n=1 Tax=Stereum hirsutum (strain FP-91666) TaxID=721885 RepID=UPI000444A2F4|nr:uncharacterized protein STEHIDRAFT_159190 [Stereum hirsutum FP-91666 SS1]EIM84522.1 hypothetical protein STEHIDRAFT_159190 [Stereum hirsutum FP-91666 SS1]